MCCKLLLYIARRVISEGPNQFPANIIQLDILLRYDLYSPERRLAIMEVFKRYFSVLIALLLFYINIDNINIKKLLMFLDYKRSAVATYMVLILET